jgi:hypothetical protein
MVQCRPCSSSEAHSTQNKPPRENVKARKVSGEGAFRASTFNTQRPYVRRRVKLIVNIDR